ncbi:ATP-binding protein [Spirulina sp. CS-785/01]|uniref:ATP-binding protein n=1 Tax=Spirulina sp. CS-785/01 TaxID=3021716 RepID=UPI00232B8822|nr:ATP-binding protein [Spirulina sp. CS-785/01]MDB9315148.1 ATP-binding protein [Spirulina sp. CS-785/01]
MTPPPNKKGGLLTPTGQQKIETAIGQTFAAENLRSSSAKIAQQAGIPVDVAIAILYRQRIADLKSLKTLFKTFGVRLRREDYDIVKPDELDSNPPSEEETPLESLWKGREELIATCIQQLQGETWVLVLQGITGMGKTALAKQLLAQSELTQNFPLLLQVDFSQNLPQFPTVARQVLGEEITQKTLQDGGETALVEAVVAKLQSQPCLLLLDSGEELLGGERFASHSFEQFFAQLTQSENLRSRLILTSQTPLPLPPFKTHQLTLPGLTKQTIEQLFQAWGIPLNSEADQQNFAEMVKISQGHPLTLKMIAGEIRTYPYYGNLRAYWQDYGYEYDLPTPISNPSASSPEAPQKRDLSQWVNTTLDRACQRLYPLYPLAYELLCLGATHPHPAPAKGWYFLIGDFSLQDQEEALGELKKRFFLEEENLPQTVCYHLPKVLRRIILQNIPKVRPEGETA